MILLFDFLLDRGPNSIRIQGHIAQQITGVFGPSGAGKTTLLHLIAGIEKAKRGYLHLDGEVLFDSERRIDVPCHRRRIGVVFQEGRLFPHQSILANLRYGESLTPASQRRFELDTVVELLELRPLLRMRPHQCSGGEAQRVALGRALLSSPRLLLLDEPLASLDQGLKRQILPFLRRVKDEIGIPMLFVSHNLQELLYLTDRMLVLNRGRVLGEGPFLDLIQNPQVWELIHDLGILNVVSLIVQSHQEQEGCMQLVPEHAARGNAALWTGPFKAVAVNTRICAMLRPEDIALVKAPVQAISIRNQIPGVIRNIVFSSHKALCVVDAGIPLLAEVTPNAIHALGLEKGQAIWCLFKSQALRYLA